MVCRWVPPYNELDMRNLLPEPYYSLAELAWPPADLHVPLVLQPVKLNFDGEAIRVRFKHKYKGPHTFGIRAENKIPMPVDTYDWGGRFQVTISAGDESHLSRDCGDSPSPWWSQSGNGFSLFYYNVPTEVPLHRIIDLEFQVIRCGKGFPSQLGAAAFYVRRMDSK